MKIIRYICVIAILVLHIGCKPSGNQNREGIEIKDRVGRTVIVPTEVNRIVGLRAGTLRLLTYLDAVPLVVGIEEGESRTSRPYLDAYPELLELPFIGPMMGGDAEAIAAVRPDVIFTAYVTAGDADALQRKTGVPVVVVECAEIGTLSERESLYESLRLIGKVLGKTARADSLITYTEEQITELYSRTALIPETVRPTAYVGGISYSGTKDIASTQVVYPPFVFVHANNVAAEIDKRKVSHVKGTYIDKEQLLLWNPDVIFIDEHGLTLALKDLKSGGALSGHLKAVDTNKIYTLLPYNNYAINYELVLIDAWYVGKVLYPEAFEDIDMNSKGNEVVEMFFRRPVFDKLVTENSFRQIDKEKLQ